MLGKIKKVFFSGVFGVLYISFVGQLIYILGWVDSIEDKMKLLALLSVEWLVLIAARYLSKRSSSSQQRSGFNGHRR
ncbi:MAG: hypothetical protein IJR92_02985 [Alphaproteobacteria bacterium]|nr:hypothetical protein [Alphaproteobacteria bacterium]